MAFIAMVLKRSKQFQLGKNDEDPISENEAPNFDDDPNMAADSSDSLSSKSNGGFELRRTGACKVLTSTFFLTGPEQQFLSDFIRKKKKKG